MKTNIYDQIKTSVPITADGVNFPEGTLGTVIEIYSDPSGSLPNEYCIDLAIPNPRFVTGYEYHNIILRHEQFTITE